MGSLDSLPADQRAVLQLVLQRGRSYDEIANMLSIDRASVRDRALAAFDAIGPQTPVEPQRRALITDYLLDQLPGRVSDQVRRHLAEDAAASAWGRVLASELAEFANGPLPEIPAQPDLRDRAALPGRPDLSATQAPARAREPETGTAPVGAGPRKRRGEGAPEIAAEVPPAASDHAPTAPPATSQARKGPRSRVSGAILVVFGAAVVAAVVIVLVTSGSSSKHSSTPHQPASTQPARSAARATATATKTSSTPRIVAQINLNPPTATSRARGIADVVTQGSKTAVAIEAQGLAANSTHPPNAYAVWLYNSPADSDRLGFVNPGVTSTGTLQTAGALPANAARYKRLIVTLETVADPRIPGPIVLEGTLTGV